MVCQNCGRDVAPAKKFSWGWFILWFILFPMWVFYLIYFFAKTPRNCPVCGRNVYVKGV